MHRRALTILFGIIIFTIFTAFWGSLEIKSSVYALSLTVKSIIIALLPWVVFGLIFKTTLQFSSNATKLILLLLVAVSGSNLISTLLSYFVGQFVYTLDMHTAFPETSESLMPLWHIQLPKWIGNGEGMLAGFVTGFVLSRKAPEYAKKVSIICDKTVSSLLRFILLLVPFLLAGSVIKMIHDKVIGDMLLNYSSILLIVIVTVYSYLFFLYSVLSQFRWSVTLEKIKNMLPAAITGFCTMSSASAMPLSLIGAEKNCENKEIAKSLIPATVNIHMIGDSIAIPILSFAVLKSFDLPFPSFFEYLIFVGFFVLAKFSVAGVPGGSILVMLPILESHLHFNAEMISLITALYFLFDPVCTAANILGNGAFAIGFEKLFQKQPISIDQTINS